VDVVVVGEDKVVYGADNQLTGNQTFKQWCIEKYRPDLSRIHFIGRLPPAELSQLLSLSDLHIYLTAPFVLSWSLMNAMSCGCPILGSDTAPVREVIHEGSTGLLAGFFNVDQMTEKALQALESPQKSRELGANARKLIESKYEQSICLKEIEQLFRETAKAK
jgi:glycosyltransferase involved in cell wall biosynthesis